MKKFNKILAAIMVFAMTFGSIPAWAVVGHEIKINSTGTVTPSGYGGSYAGIDSTVASSTSEDEVYSISTDGTITTAVWGIKSTSNLSIGSLKGGIMVENTVPSTDNLNAIGIYAEGTGTTTVNKLGNVSVTSNINLPNEGDKLCPIGIDSKGTADSFRNNVTFVDGATISVTANRSASLPAKSEETTAIGIIARGKGKTTINNLGGLNINLLTDMQAYGIQSKGDNENFENNVSFSRGATMRLSCDDTTDSGCSICGIRAIGLGTTTVTNLGHMTIEGRSIVAVMAQCGTTTLSFAGDNTSVNLAGKSSSLTTGMTNTNFVGLISNTKGADCLVDIKGADSINRTKVTFDGANKDGGISAVLWSDTLSEKKSELYSVSLENMDITDLPDGEKCFAICAAGSSGTESTVALKNTLLKGNVSLKDNTGYGLTKANVKVTLDKDSVWYLDKVVKDEGSTGANEKLTIDTAGTIIFSGSGDGSVDATISNSGTLAFRTAKTTLTGATTLGSGSKLAFYLDGFKAGETIVDSSANPISLSNATVQLWQEQTPTLAEGEALTLLKGASGYTAKEVKTLHDGQGVQTYKYNTYLNDDSLMAEYSGVGGVAEESKSLSEGFIAGSVALMQASDLSSGEAIASAQTAAETASGNSVVPYATIQGGHGRYHTGSHVDLNSTQIAAGLAKKFSDSTTAGLLIEGGEGRYTSYNEFTSGELRADGEVKYYGVGIFGRHSFSKSNIGNAYVDAAFSVGRTNQDYRTNDIMGMQDYHYDIGVIYLKAHATAGYEWHLGKASLDGYVKYLWACQNGATINFNGQDVNFDTINSHRVRVGARYTQKMQEALSWYGGLAFEYEFDLSAGANSQGLAIAEPDLKGASGMAEVGLKYSPIKANNWLFDLGLEGFMGKKDSLSVRLSTWYTF